MLLEHIAPDQARRIAEQLCAALTDPIPIGPDHVQLSASIGLAHTHPGDATDVHTDAVTDPNTLLRQADLAMYLAKRAGKNCYRTLDPDTTRVPPPPPAGLPVRCPATPP